MTSLLLNSLFPGLLVLSVGYSAYIFNRLSEWSLGDKLLVSTIPPGVVMAAGIMLRQALDCPFQGLETIDLLPAYMIAHGLNLYYGVHNGPVLDMMYGPMNAVAYWPVTLFSHLSDSGAMIGEFITAFYYFIPAIWLIFGGRWRNSRQLAYCAAIFLAFILYSIQSPVLGDSAFSNHADAPALGWAGLACMLILQRDNRMVNWRLWCSAICAVLSVWTKQVMLPIVAAIPLYIFLADDARTAWRYFIRISLVSVVAFVGFMWGFGFKEVWFNLVVHPWSEPWEVGLMKVQGRAVVELMQECRWSALILASYLVYDSRSWFQTASDMRKWFQHHSWTLFMLVGLMMIPTSILGRIKIAGALNALSFSVYFLAMAVVNLALDVYSSRQQRTYDPLANMISKVVVIFYVISSTMLQGPPLGFYFMHLTTALSRLEHTPSSYVYEFARTHPDEVYFPRNTLSYFLSTGRLTHYDVAVYERYIAGFPVVGKHFDDFLPPKMKWVAYPPDVDGTNFIKMWLPEFSKQTTLPELPGFAVYIRPDLPVAAVKNEGISPKGTVYGAGVQRNPHPLHSPFSIPISWLSGTAKKDRHS